MGGQTIDEVENLIKKHEAFEEAAAAQEERFAALERLTTFELKELRRKQDEAEEERRRQVEEIARQSEKPDGTDRRSETGSIKSGRQQEPLVRRSSQPKKSPVAAEASPEAVGSPPSASSAAPIAGAAAVASPSPPVTSPEVGTDSEAAKERE